MYTYTPKYEVLMSNHAARKNCTQTTMPTATPTVTLTETVMLTATVTLTDKA